MKKFLAIAVALVIGLLWWHLAQPDPPQTRFLASVHKSSPETRTMKDDIIANYGYHICGLVKIKGLDGVTAETDAETAAGVTYALSVSAAAMEILCPFTDP
jgi:hypothetical protein